MAITQHIINQWADEYSPLSQDAEVFMSRVLPSRQDLLEHLLKHNARQIIKLAGIWTTQNDFDKFKYSFDDAISLIVIGYHKALVTWNRQYRFYIWANLHARSELKNTRIVRTNEGISNFVYEDEDGETVAPGESPELSHAIHCKKENIYLLLDELEYILDPIEYDFIVDIYFNGYTVEEAGANFYKHKTRSNSSNKHRAILTKLKENLRNDR